MRTYNIGTSTEIYKEHAFLSQEWKQIDAELLELEANKERFAHYYDEIYNKRIERKKTLEFQIQRCNLRKSYHETALRSGIYYGLIDEDCSVLDYPKELIKFIGNAFDGIYIARFKTLLDLTYSEAYNLICDYSDYGDFKAILEFQCFPDGRINMRLVELEVKYELKELKEVDWDDYDY